MINATTEKSFSNRRYITLKLMVADDPLIMYYIKKNYTIFTDIDTGKLKRSLKYKQFLKSSKSKSITDFDDVTIIDDKNHSTGKEGNVVFVDDGNRKRVVLNFIEKKASSTSSTSKAKKPSTKMTATQRRYLAMKKLEDEEDTIDETASRVLERIKSEAIGGANPPPTPPRNNESFMRSIYEFNESNRQANPPRNEEFVRENPLLPMEELVRANPLLPAPPRYPYPQPDDSSDMEAPYSRGYQPRQAIFKSLVEQPETKETKKNRLNAKAEEKSRLKAKDEWNKFYNFESELKANDNGTLDDDIDDNNDTITYRDYLEKQMFKNIEKFLFENIWQIRDKTLEYISMKDARFRIYDYELVVDILNLDDEIKHLDDLERENMNNNDDFDIDNMENQDPSQTGGVYCYNNPNDLGYNKTLEYNQKSDETNKKRIVADIYHDFSSKFVGNKKTIEAFMSEFQDTMNDVGMFSGNIENNYVGLHKEYLKRHSESFWIVFPTLADIDLQRMFAVRPVVDTGIHRPLYKTIFSKDHERTAATLIDPITQDGQQNGKKLALIADGDTFFKIPLDVINDLSKKFYTSSFNDYFKGYYVEFYVRKKEVQKNKNIVFDDNNYNNYNYQLQYRISNYLKKGIEKKKTSRYIDINFGFNTVNNVTTYINGGLHDADAAHLFELEDQLNSLTDRKYASWGAKLFIVALKSFGDFIQFEYVSKYNYSLKQAKNNFQQPPTPENIQQYKDTVDYTKNYGIMMTKDKIAFYHGVHTCCPGILGSHTTPKNNFMKMHQELYENYHQKLLDKFRDNNIEGAPKSMYDGNEDKEKSHFALIFHGNLPTTSDSLMIRQSKNLDEMKGIINELKANQYRKVILILSKYGDPYVYNKSHIQEEEHTSLYNCILEKDCRYFVDDISTNKNIEENILEKMVQRFANNLGTMRNFISQSKSITNTISRLTIKNSLYTSLINPEISVGLKALIDYKEKYHDISGKLKSKIRDFIIDFAQPKSLEEIYDIEAEIMLVINKTLEIKTEGLSNKYHNTRGEANSIVPYSDITNKDLVEFKSKITEYLKAQFETLSTFNSNYLKTIKSIADQVNKIKYLSKFFNLEIIIEMLEEIVNMIDKTVELKRTTARQNKSKLDIPAEIAGYEEVSNKLIKDLVRISFHNEDFTFVFEIDSNESYDEPYILPTYGINVYNAITEVVDQRMKNLQLQPGSDYDAIFQEEKQKLIIELSALYKKNLMYFTVDDVIEVKEEEKKLSKNALLAKANIEPIDNPYANKIIFKKFKVDGTTDKYKIYKGIVDGVRMVKDDIYYHITYEDGDHEEQEKEQIANELVFTIDDQQPEIEQPENELPEIEEQEIEQPENEPKTYDNKDLCEITAWEMVQEGDVSKVKVQAKYRNDKGIVWRDLFDILTEGGYEHAKKFMETQKFKNTDANLWRTGLKKFSGKLYRFITAEHQTVNTDREPDFKPYYVVYSDTDSEPINEKQLIKAEGLEREEAERLAAPPAKRKRMRGGKKLKTIAQQSKRVDKKLVKLLQAKLKIKSKK